jgi:hypothetical protein
MPSPQRHECARRPSTERRSSNASASILMGWALLLAAECTFPEYETRVLDPGAAGTGTSSGSGTDAGSSGQGGVENLGGTQNGGGSSSVGGEPSQAGEGGGPACEGEQWPVDRCDGGCRTRFPDHCYDYAKSEDELSVDCGGSCQPCVVEPCAQPSDCLSGVCADGPEGSTCESPLMLLHEAHEKSDSVGSTAWSLTLQNVGQSGGKVFALRDLSLRYYLDRNGAVEPILVRATQANLHLMNGMSSSLAGARWNLARVEDGQDATYNAYVEVSFEGSGQLFPGDDIQLYQQMLTGDPSLSSFDQRANYSFSKDVGPWEHVTVHYRGELVWGLEPRPVNPRACFVKGVNLNGPAVSIDGNAWLSSDDASVSGTSSGTTRADQVFPAVVGDTAAMLGSAFHVEAGNHLLVPAENGAYLLYLYAVSPGTDAQPSALTVNGTSYFNSSRFRSQASDGGLAWARLGPYRLDVTTGAVKVDVTTGAIDFAGFELWYPQ